MSKRKSGIPIWAWIAGGIALMSGESNSSGSEEFDKRMKKLDKDVSELEKQINVPTAIDIAIEAGDESGLKEAIVDVLQEEKPKLIAMLQEASNKRKQDEAEFAAKEATLPKRNDVEGYLASQETEANESLIEVNSRIRRVGVDLEEIAMIDNAIIGLRKIDADSEKLSMSEQDIAEIVSATGRFKSYDEMLSRKEAQEQELALLKKDAIALESEISSIITARIQQGQL